MNRETFINHFISSLGQPFSSEYLTEYIDLCLSNDILIEPYSELHHILPKSKFPEFVNEDWNKVKLGYSNHCKVHFLLMKAYPINNFIKPVNFMKKNKLKDMLTSEELSYRRRKQYENMSDETKNQIKLEASKRTKLRMQPGNPVFEKMQEKNRQRWANTANHIKVSEFFSSLWKNDDRKEKWIKSMKDTFTEERKQKISEDCKARWQDEEYRKIQTEKSTPRITSKEHLDKTAEINRELWKTEEYRQKQIISRKASIQKRKESGDYKHSEIMKAKWNDPEWKAIQLDKRKQTKLLRKENETNKD